MKRAVLLSIVALVLTGCLFDSQNRRDTAVVEQQQSHYAQVQPIPFFDFSMDRDTLIQIYKAKNESRLTYSVVTSDGTGDVLFICPSIGFGIPADTSLTNPLGQTAPGSGVIVEQAEPNGVFSSKNTDGTYILCIRDDGTVNVVQTEGKVTTFPFPVKVDAEGRIVDAGGESTVQIQVKEGVEGTAPAPSVAP